VGESLGAAWTELPLRAGPTLDDRDRQQAKVLPDNAAPREQRLEALKFVVHFVDDLHQPLQKMRANAAQTSVNS